MNRARLGTLLLLLAGCHPAARPPPPETPGSLVGQTLPLLPSPQLWLAVEGHLNGRPLPVVLDVARALSAVSSGCWDEKRPPPPVVGTAHVPDVYAGLGGVRDWPLVRLSGLRVGGVLLGPRGMGLTGEHACAVTLGADVLTPYAFTVEPLRREVSFEASRPREAWLAEASAPAAGTQPAEDIQVLELSREPVGDWPLLAARVTQGAAVLTGPFVLGTREPFSRLAVGPAEAQGLQGLEPVAGLPPRAYLADSVEVAAGVGASPLVLEAGVGWKNPTTLGRLGPDVWGRFRATVDIQGHTLVLRRPHVSGGEGPQRCARPASPAEAPREEACFALHVRKGAGDRMALTGAVFRDLPEGGRVHLEPLGEDGQPLALDCQVGFSFPPTSRGVTTQHLVPWPKLARTMPECADALRSVHGYALALFEEGPLAECPHACVFVHQPSTQRTVCECQPTPLGEGSALPPRSHTPRPPSRQERELEPEDPR